MTVASLTEAGIVIGNLRGLNAFKIEFKYPISVIAGRNRSGKSTILAMIACAFHNSKDGFKLPERKVSYYTFSDFFIQSSEEIPPGGIAIEYRIMHNKWHKSPKAPDGVGNFHQARYKREKGKWNKYSRRVNRNVVFFGVQRVVPPSEKSVSRSYKSYFSDQAPAGWENQVKEVAGRILGTVYEDFKMKVYKKYHLPIVTSQKTQYSGFNMGAGENALFEIFSTIYATPRGTLLVIDEIELGLHESAQRRLIQELKEVCRQRHIQVVCTTHSPAILEEVPPEACFYTESFSGKTNILPCVTPLYAAGKLAGESTNELDVYVEDTDSAILIAAFIETSMRKRVNIIPIGSPITIIHQMAARYKDPKKCECITIMDGDQAHSLNLHKSQFLKSLESNKDAEQEVEWLMRRLAFLPGNVWPEKWLIETLRSVDVSGLAELLHISKEELSSYVDDAASASKHNEVYNLAKNLSLDPIHVYYVSAAWLLSEGNADFQPIYEIVNSFLS
jgi:predicted ATPase